VELKTPAGRATVEWFFKYIFVSVGVGGVAGYVYIERNRYLNILLFILLSRFAFVAVGISN